MDALLALLSLLLATAIAVADFERGAPALILAFLLSIICLVFISKIKDDSYLLQRLFIGGLLARCLVAGLTYNFNLQAFFGGDSLTYDEVGALLVKVWEGDYFYRTKVNSFIGLSGWGMLYYVATVYKVIGRNPLAIQFLSCIMGAITAPIMYVCAREIYENIRVARTTAILVAFYPSLILWTSQGLKDGPIIFLLAMSVLSTIKLSQKITFKYLIVLVCGLLCILTFRFYIFYMLVATVAGALFLGSKRFSAQNIIKQFIVIFCIGLTMTYVGVLRTAQVQIEVFGNLKTVQTTRLDYAESGESGYGRDEDVSTASGAIRVLPLGFVYLLLAPFPWQLASLRQGITIPEMVIWWASIPLMVIGLWFTIKYRLRPASSILLFVTMLTIAYSIFLGNVGTVYRQRSQLLIFFFIFVSVGYVLLKERSEARKYSAVSPEQVKARA
jgi:hypothetical protein